MPYLTNLNILNKVNNKKLINTSNIVKILNFSFLLFLYTKLFIIDNYFKNLFSFYKNKWKKNLLKRNFLFFKYNLKKDFFFKNKLIFIKPEYAITVYNPTSFYNTFIIYTNVLYKNNSNIVYKYLYFILSSINLFFFFKILNFYKISTLKKHNLFLFIKAFINFNNFILLVKKNNKTSFLISKKNNVRFCNLTNLIAFNVKFI